jgi:hypothetical protein
MASHSDLIARLLLKLAFWAALSFGVAAFVVLKAVVALRAGRRYRFTFLDGGLLFRGKETSPRLMLGLAAVYAFGVSLLIAWPLGLYQWLDDATSGCRDVLTMTDVRRFAGDGVGTARVDELRTFCSLRVSSTDHAPLLDLEISGHGGIDARGSEEMVLASGARVHRVDRGTTRTLWLAGASGGSMCLALHGDRFDETEIRELALLMGARRDVLERYAARWRKPPSPVLRTLRRNPVWVLAVLVVLVVAGVVTLRVRQSRAFRRALEDD